MSHTNGPARTPPLLAAREIARAGGILLIALSGLALAGGGCGGKKEEKTSDPTVVGPGERDSEHAKRVPKVRFTDVTAKAGIDFRHVNGAFGKRLMPETLGSGVAFLDYDRDGKPDLLFVNSCYWPGYEKKDAPAPTLALYRNKGGTYEDVTKAAGLNVTMYGMGVTVGDYDNDGFDDVFVTGVGGSRLFRNAAAAKGRRFEDVTEKSGGLRPQGALATAGDFLEREAPLDFPSSAAFLDYDNDGLLDLFVCNYVTWSPKADLSQKFNLQGGHGRAYGPPTHFVGTFCQLFRNKGEGKFEDVSAGSGVQVTAEQSKPGAKALGVLVCDPDDDGWPDVIVANDTVRNFFFHNQKGKGFVERGLQSGVAYAEGLPRGAMGIDGGYYKSGRYAVAIGNFANEPNTLFRLDQPARLLFSDVALIEGLAGPSRIVLKFGLFFFDFDLDGLLDLLTCNGHLEPNIALVQAGQSYRQPAQLFWNTGDRPSFQQVMAKDAGEDLFRPLVGRGCAYADIDGDGDLDVVLTENGGPARLLVNEGGTGNNWVRVHLKGDGKKCNASAIGASVTLTAGGKTQRREVVSSRGYLSSSERVLTFGLGKAKTVDRVEIKWPGPDRRPQVVEGLEANRLHVIEKR